MKRRWTMELIAPGVKIHSYGTRLLDHSVQVDGRVVTVTTSREVKSMELLQVSVSTTTISTTVNMKPGETLEVTPDGLRGSALPGSAPAGRR